MNYRWRCFMRSLASLSAASVLVMYVLLTHHQLRPVMQRFPSNSSTAPHQHTLARGNCGSRVNGKTDLDGSPHNLSNQQPEESREAQGIVCPSKHGDPAVERIEPSHRNDGKKGHISQQEPFIKSEQSSDFREQDGALYFSQNRKSGQAKTAKEKVTPKTSEEPRKLHVLGRISTNVPLQRSDGKTRARSEMAGNAQETREEANSDTNSYLYSDFNGRLGNVLFKAASSLCIAKQNNLSLVFCDDKNLKDLQYNGTIVSKLACKQLLSNFPGKILKVGAYGYEDELLNLRPRKASYFLQGFCVSWKYFEPCKKMVRQALSFNQNIRRRAAEVIDDLRKNFTGKALVGIHVRREDFLRNRVGLKVAPPSYFKVAMTHFRKLLGKVQFVAITSDPQWFKNNVSTADDVIVLDRSRSPAVDMEMLSRTDHLIASTGTFSWWAAYKKSKGMVTICKDFFKPGTKVGQYFVNETDHYLYPGWTQL